MFPPIAPFASGYLPVGDGNEIYWETSGNPKGKPALHVHGGPGSGMGEGYRRRFDPAQFLIVGFEQRGCGRSSPLAIDALDRLATNTTDALIADMEALREHLGIERWLLAGLSWGTTLALAYAQAHPERVSELLLFAVTTTSASEVAWITEEMGRIFPEEWERFEAASGRQPGQRVIDAYYERITDPDPAVREAAARAWCRWEDTHISLLSNTTDSMFDDLAFSKVFATLVIHYWKHAGFPRNGGILANMDRIAHIPGVLIHGRADISSPLITAWQVHKAWPSSELTIFTEGHGGDEMIDELVRATHRFAPDV